MSRNQRRIFFFAAKASTSFSLNYTNAIFGKVEELHQGFVNIVGTLHRTPDSYTVEGIRDCDGAVVFNVELFLRAGVILAFYNQVRAWPDFVNISLLDQKLFEDVVFAPDNLLFRQ